MNESVTVELNEDYLAKIIEKHLSERINTLKVLIERIEKIEENIAILSEAQRINDQFLESFHKFQNEIFPRLIGMKQDLYDLSVRVKELEK